MAAAYLLRVRFIVVDVFHFGLPNIVARCESIRICSFIIRLIAFKDASAECLIVDPIKLAISIPVPFIIIRIRYCFANETSSGVDRAARVVEVIT